MSGRRLRSGRTSTTARLRRPTSGGEGPHHPIRLCKAHYPPPAFPSCDHVKLRPKLFYSPCHPPMNVAHSSSEQFGPCIASGCSCGGEWGRVCWRTMKRIFIHGRAELLRQGSPNRLPRTQSFGGFAFAGPVPGGFIRSAPPRDGVSLHAWRTELLEAPCRAGRWISGCIRNPEREEEKKHLAIPLAWEGDGGMGFNLPCEGGAETVWRPCKPDIGIRHDGKRNPGPRPTVGQG